MSASGKFDSIVTLDTVYVSANYAYVDIAASEFQKELILTNTDSSLPVYARDTTAVTTTQVGTKIAAGLVCSLQTGAAVRLTNPGASTVAVIANRLLSTT